AADALHLPLKGGGRPRSKATRSGGGLLMMAAKNWTPTRLASRADLPLSGGGIRRLLHPLPKLTITTSAPPLPPRASDRCCAAPAEPCVGCGGPTDPSPSYRRRCGGLS